MKKYESYKDSGIDWVGEVPKHWNPKKLRFAGVIVNGSTPSSGSPNFWDGNIVWVTPSDLSRLKDNYVNSSERKITSEGLDSCGTTLVPEGSVVLTTRAPIGNLALAGTELCTNQGCKSIITNNNFNSLFLYYQLFSGKEELISLGSGTTFKELSTESLKSFKVVEPPLKEQNAIVNFLNTKTANIDALIKKKKQMIALLEEEKTAFINEAVTKGLCLDTHMEDSGIEWLGILPAHWKVKKLKHISKLISGAAFDSGEFLKNGNFKVIKITNIQHDRIDWDDIEFISDDYAQSFLRFRVENGDILFALTRPIISTGIKSARVVIEEDAKVLLNQRNAILRADETTSQEFLYYYTLSDYFFKMFEASIDSTGQQPNISPVSIHNFSICLPPLNEQIEISKAVQRECTRIENLKNSFVKEISLLKEYRTALVSEAVTGKIDVRDYQPEPINLQQLELA
ncbi:restriction endonuclease subunit S [Rufibacter sp. LB8]|uniref:restriction endonuclease subunit S n=1 Tax=Rufibacter sp. LB8 TaxID=2777781 RepID=UPI00178C6BBD|nr:restriction endonuclease subunit S [Rufibacter sp. LB8]